MAISNYTELQTFLSNWTHRSDLSSVMPDIIKLAESYLNRKLRTRSQDVTENLTADTASRFLAFPNRMAELCDLSIVVDGEQRRLQQVGKEQMYSLSVEQYGRPTAYCIGDQIEFDCIPDSAYVVKAHFYKTLSLSDDSTNYVLTNFPDVYLHACMAAVNLYTKADPSSYLSLMEAAIKGINSNEARNKSTTLVTDLRASAPFDISRGY